MANEKRLIDASPDDCIKKVKRKTNFAKIIVSGTAEKPYYDIMWFDYMDGQYHVGYGSFNLNFVVRWLAECFEVEESLTVDAVEVVRCKECYKRGKSWCPFSYKQVQDDDFCSYGERRDGNGV